MLSWIRILAFLVGALATGFTAATQLSDALNFEVGDALLRIMGPRDVPKDVVVVAIDEASYADLRVPLDPPWPRAMHAALLHRLRSLGAKRVVFDILFVGEGGDAAGDSALAAALGTIPTVIGVDSTVRSVTAAGGGYLLEELVQPFELFRKNSVSALVGVEEDRGVVRRFPLPRTSQEKRYPFLAQAAAEEDVANLRLPTDRDLISYYGPGRSIPIYSYWEVLRENLPLPTDAFKDKIVFVGLLLRSATGASQKDAFRSPFGGEAVFGVEVHATMAANLIEGRWLHRFPALLECGWQGVVGGVLTGLAFGLSPLALALTIVGVGVVWLSVAIFSLLNGVFIGGCTIIVVVAPLIMIANGVYGYAITRRSEQTLKSAFELYVSPDMVPRVAADPCCLKLGGEKVWVTAVFTDIENFTSISEEMPAEKVSEMLNAYFSEVMEAVFKNRGTVLKFIGDAVFALWGAPISLPNHAALAIDSALEIMRGVEAFNTSGRFPRLRTRIGVHTGPMLVGNLGCERRFDYTAIGDAVNLTSRVEGINRIFGTELLFTEATRRDAGGVPRATPVATVRVKGRRESVRLFTIFEPPLTDEAEKTWLTALEAFTRADFVLARELFQEIKVRDSRLIQAADVYVDASGRLSSDPPGRGWQGELDFERSR